MDELIWIIIGVFLIIVGISISFGASIWKNRSDPTVGWTWGMILLLVAGIIIGIIGVILVFVGLWKQITYHDPLVGYLEGFPKESRQKAANDLMNECTSELPFDKLKELAKNPIYRSLYACEAVFKQNKLW